MSKYIILLFICFSFTSYSQTNSDKGLIRQIYDHALTESLVYKNLASLCNEVPHRPAGSEGYNKAVSWSISKLEEINIIDTIYTQACEVDAWDRGQSEIVKIVRPYKEEINIHATSLGNSVSTENDGILSEVIEVYTINELEQMNVDDVKGKIVFFNRPMDPKQIHTFRAYSKAVDQRVWGPNLASEKGAIACLVRSMTLAHDHVPHTGVTVFKDGILPIPALAISTVESDMLSNYMEQETVQIFIQTDSKSKGKTINHNVIAEIKGTEFPDEIILIGGHLDAWDVGEGAHDDGAGIVQSMEVMNTFNQLGYQPKRTIRCVYFANEEKGLDGGLKYAEISNQNNEKHIAAIESDAGGFTPRGFSMDAIKDLKENYYTHIKNWQSLFDPYLIKLEKGGSGADIGPLKSQGGILLGLKPDSQRYFDVHHSDNDVFETIHKRELEMGAGAMASLVYLLDQYGIHSK